MTLLSHKELLVKQLKSRGLSELFELLLRLEGMKLNKDYALHSLYAVGGQSILYQAKDRNGQTVIVKMPLLLYHRAAYINIDDIRVARRRLETEAQLLQLFQGSILPEFYDLLYTNNPLHPQLRGEEIVNQEPYLLMEFVHGYTLHELTHILHRALKPDYSLIENLAWHIAVTIINFSLFLSQQTPGYLYADLNPQNFIVTYDLNNPIRILDAGSIISLQYDPTVFPPFTPAYASPDYFEAYKKNQPLWPSIQHTMYALGKVLWETLTNRQPHASEDPDLYDSKLQNYSPALREMLTSLIGKQFDSFEQLGQALTSKQVIPTSKYFAQTLAHFINADKGSESKFEPISKVADSATFFINMIRNLRLTKKQSAYSKTIQRILHSPDGIHLAVASKNNIELWDWSTLQQIQRFQSPHTISVASLDFDASGQYLVSGSSDGTICFWDIATQGHIWKYYNPQILGQVALDAQANLMAVSTEANVATFHPQRTLFKGAEFNGIWEQIDCVAIAKQRALLAIGGLSGVRLWDLTTQREQGAKKLRVDTGTSVDRIIFTENEQILATVNRSQHNLQPMSHHSIILWDLLSYKPLREITFPSGNVADMRLLPGQQLVCVCVLNGNLWMWGNEQKGMEFQIEENGRISSLDFVEDGRTLIIATVDGELSVYNLHT